MAWPRNCVDAITNLMDLIAALQFVWMIIMDYLAIDELIAGRALQLSGITPGGTHETTTGNLSREQAT